ncbi:MAG TPA: tetraacyldisaccharide 4'-kinase [Gammaproteobacteria bacterium]|nr:tetraacyldisaccharide 4'-kinase [Gammaproteobacteria bacterium]
MGRWFSDRLLAGWYSTRPVWFLVPFAWLFGMLPALRRAAYRYGVFNTATLPVPVIVAGNISVGGTGKTPFILWLARALKDRGHAPGIVTRGYGGSARDPCLVTPESDPGVVGDEAVLLARRSGVPVAAGRDRVAAVRLLLASSRLDLILSDDGLQHYHLPRALEIVLLDGARGLGNGWLLPAGPLREKPERLDAVGLVVIKRGGTAVFSRAGAAIMDLSQDAMVSLKDGERLPLASFAGQAVHAVAGVGHPEQFFKALESSGLKIDRRPLPDHARLGARELRFDDELPVFMTEKDAVKCLDMDLPRHWYVEASANFNGSDARRILTAVEALLTK